MLIYTRRIWLRVRPGVMVERNKNCAILCRAQTSKNSISSKKLSIFTTSKNWLNIFEKSFINIEAMDHIYQFYKTKITLVELLRRSSEKVQASKSLT
jgi:hypothetical protein